MAMILITGGAQRVGKVLAQYLGAIQKTDLRGQSVHTIIIHYNTSGLAANALCDDINKQGGQAVCIAADLSNISSADTLIHRAAILVNAPIDVLINNASVFDYDTVDNIDPEIMQTAMDVNYRAPVLLSQAMTQQTDSANVQKQSSDSRKLPVIINILDQKLWNLNPDFYSYTASKAALRTATEMMFDGYKSKARVCAIAPGILLPSFDQTKDEFTKTACQNLLQKPIDIQELAKACAFIIQTNAVHGQIFHIDNGQRFVTSNRDIMFQT